MSYTINSTILEANNINQTLNGKEILKNVNFSIKDIQRPGLSQGQIVSLIGKSGIGKSTLFRIITGLDQPTSGEINLLGKPVCAGDVGMVPQNYLLLNWRTVKKNLEIAVNLNSKILENDKNEYLKQIVSEFQLEEHLNKYPNQLSGGQRQRVSIIQQIVNGSDVILLDEPFSGLDSIMIDKVSEILIRVSLQHELKTLIIVSHDILNSVAISDTVYLMNKPNPNEGASIVKTIDLMERGLAWNSNVRELPEFHNTLKEIKSLL